MKCTSELKQMPNNQCGRDAEKILDGNRPKILKKVPIPVRLDIITGDRVCRLDYPALLG
jgi:hypothetical protein